MNILIAIAVGTTLAIITQILEIRFKLDEKSILCGYFTGIIMCLIIFSINIVKRQNYTQNIETKLNIYEQEYNNFVLEDSLRQSDVYE